MSRLLVGTLIVSLSTSSMAFAGESLMQSASRIAREAAQAQVAETAASGVAGPRTGSVSANNAANWVNRVSSPTALALQDGQPVLSKSGMKKRTKMMIYLAAGVGLAGAAWAIDHHVVDVTPSSLGTRKD